MTDDNPHLVPIEGPIDLARATPGELQEEIRTVVASPIVRALLDALDGALLVLNAHRQIVAANLRSLLLEGDVTRALGLRPGEALHCEHANELPGGCGAAEACRTCGALKIVLGCQTSHGPSQGECLVSTVNGESRALELRLRATPVEVDGRTFTVLAMRDASDEKRRGVLEQVFLHDLLNSLTVAWTWSHMMLELPENQLRPSAERVASSLRRIEAEIRGHRTILSAENGTLEPTAMLAGTLDVLRELVADFSTHPLARDRAVVLEGGPNVLIETDTALLSRVLTNMVKNALEATPEGGRVRVWCEGPDAGARWACALRVHNEAVMPRAVAQRVFQRSFSTKGQRGRGLGTYSMKLLGERYLQGEVSFTSCEGEGTTFTLRLPRAPRAR